MGKWAQRGQEAGLRAHSTQQVQTQKSSPRPYPRTCRLRTLPCLRVPWRRPARGAGLSGCWGWGGLKAVEEGARGRRLVLRGPESCWWYPPPSRHSDSHPLKHSGLPWQPHSRAGSAPPLRRQPVLLLSPHPRAPEDRAWAESAAPRTPLLLPLDLRLTWGSGKNRGRCGVSGQPARPGGLTHLGPVPPLKVRVASPVSHGLNWETQTSQTLKFPEAQSGDRRRCGLT